MLHVTTEDIVKNFSYKEFIPFLKNYFTKTVLAPQRPHYTLDPSAESSDTLLLMPAWQVDNYIGIKLITVFEQNVHKNLNTINGIYLLVDGKTGIPLCTFDASLFTSMRTAAASALASSYLSRPDSQILTMIGTGNLCHELIQAHAAVRPIKKVFVWGRDPKKAMQKVNSFSPTHGLDIKVAGLLAEAVPQSDIVSSATFAKEPLIHGKDVAPGTHIDLVGSYQPGYREADDELISKSTLYIDTPAALHETGELLNPLSSGVISKESIEANLIQLCKGEKEGRQTQEEITWFKSVGYALEDLAMGIYLYEKMQNNV